MDYPVKPQTPPTGAPPVALTRNAFEQVRETVHYVTTFRRNRVAAGNGPNILFRPGAWAKLSSGGTITAPSGATLGSGTVTLCSRNGATLTADGETVTVYNSGGEITASGSDRYMQLAWCDGAWSVVVDKC